jgi:transposase
VVSREANINNQIPVFQWYNFIYRTIITDNYEMTDQEIVFYYNQRGSSEKIFYEMNNALVG